MAVLSAVVKSVRTKGDLVEFAIENSRESVHPKKNSGDFFGNFKFLFYFPGIRTLPRWGGFDIQNGNSRWPCFGHFRSSEQHADGCI